MRADRAGSRRGLISNALGARAVMVLGPAKPVPHQSHVKRGVAGGAPVLVLVVVVDTRVGIDLQRLLPVQFVVVAPVPVDGDIDGLLAFENEVFDALEREPGDQARLHPIRLRLLFRPWSVRCSAAAKRNGPAQSQRDMNRLRHRA